MVDVVEARAVGSAELAGDVESEAGTARERSEERLEQLRLQSLRHAVAVVEDVQFYPIATARSLHSDAARTMPAVAPGVAEKVPQYLIQVHAVELDDQIRVDVDGEAVARNTLLL